MIVSKYWLFIIPEDSFPGVLWENCIKDKVLAMEYIPSYPGFTKNMNLIKQIKVNDIVVAYLRQKRIGGIGRVVKEYFDAPKPYKGTGGDGYRQRVGVDWIYVKGNDYPTIDYKDVLGDRNLSIATIHEIPKNVFNKIEELFEKESNSYSYGSSSFEVTNLLKTKGQIIFYGPPGTGKTYKAREFAVKFLYNSYREAENE